MEHWNVEPGSVAEKVKVEVVLVVTENGAVSMTVSGGIVSPAVTIVHA